MALRLTFEQLLSLGRLLVVDGGLATQLEAQGCNVDGPLWSAALLQSNPEAITAAHTAFMNAGADIIIAASYQASRHGFAAAGIGATDADRLICSAVELAVEARDAFVREHPQRDVVPLVAASVGPYGATLHDGSEYTGNYAIGRDQLRQFHADRLTLLDRTDADLLACETIPSGLEAQVLSELLAGCRKPAWVSFSCKDETHICDSTPLADVAVMFRRHPRVLAIGINCTPPLFVTPLIETLRRCVADIPVVVYPNSGETWCADDRSWSAGDRPLDWGCIAREWAAAGALLVGGCCRIGPDQIAAISSTN